MSNELLGNIPLVLGDSESMRIFLHRLVGRLEQILSEAFNVADDRLNSNVKGITALEREIQNLRVQLGNISPVDVTDVYVAHATELYSQEQVQQLMDHVSELTAKVNELIKVLYSLGMVGE